MQIRKILVPVDFSEHSEAAVARASALALPLQADLHLFHAVPPIPYAAPVEFGYPPELNDAVAANARTQLAAWSERVRAKGCTVTDEVSQLRAVEAICEAVPRVGAELIVMGTHGRTGIKHAVLGSVAERTLRAAPCPVLTVKETPADAASPIRRVLLCTDFSAHAEMATSFAMSFCRVLGAELHVAHVIQGIFPIYGEVPPPADYLDQLQEAGEKKLAEVQRRIQGAGLEGSSNLLTGDPSLELGALAKRHALDLVVLGTRGNSGLKHVALGSVAERVLRQVSSSVLILRASNP